MPPQGPPQPQSPVAQLLAEIRTGHATLQSNNWFPQFSRLPVELREIIWLASRSPRLVSAWLDRIEEPQAVRGHFWSFDVKAEGIPIAQVCRESRLLVLARYTQLGCTGSITLQRSRSSRKLAASRQLSRPHSSNYPFFQIPHIPFSPIYIDLRHDTLVLEFNSFHKATFQVTTSLLGIETTEIQSLAISLGYLDHGDETIYQAIRALPNLQELILVDQVEDVRYVKCTKDRINLKDFDLVRIRPRRVLPFESRFDDFVENWVESEIALESVGRLPRTCPRIFLADFEYASCEKTRGWTITSPLYLDEGEVDEELGGPQWPELSTK